MSIKQKLINLLDDVFTLKEDIEEKETVLFYGADNFIIDFEEKRLTSESLGNNNYIILNIPYNARIIYNEIQENEISIEINDDGDYTLREIYETENLVLDIHKLFGEPQE